MAVTLSVNFTQLTNNVKVYSAGYEYGGTYMWYHMYPSIMVTGSVVTSYVIMGGVVNVTSSGTGTVGQTTLTLPLALSAVYSVQLGHTMSGPVSGNTVPYVDQITLSSITLGVDGNALAANVNPLVHFIIRGSVAI